MPDISKKFRTPGVCLCLIISLLAAGCASNTKVSSNWRDGKARGASFERVLVVAITDNADRRMSFEDAVALDLRSANTNAWPSARLMDTSTELNVDTIATVAERQNADVVVITRVKSFDVQAVEVQGRTDIQPQRKKGAVFRYDYVEREEEAYVTSEYTTSLTTDVVRPGSEEPIYTVVATATKQETLADVIDVLSDVIAERLRRDGLIR